MSTGSMCTVLAPHQNYDAHFSKLDREESGFEIPIRIEVEAVCSEPHHAVMITPAISSPPRELLGAVVVLEEKEKPLQPTFVTNDS
jgi:hypothetical protein